MNSQGACNIYLFCTDLGCKSVLSEFKKVEIIQYIPTTRCQNFSDVTGGLSSREFPRTWQMWPHCGWHISLRDHKTANVRPWPRDSLDWSRSISIALQPPKKVFISSIANFSSVGFRPFYGGKENLRTSWRSCWRKTVRTLRPFASLPPNAPLHWRVEQIMATWVGWTGKGEVVKWDGWVGWVWLPK